MHDRIKSNCQRASHPFLHCSSEQPAEEPLPRHTKTERTDQCLELLQSGQKTPVVFVRLAEPNSRVQHHARTRYTEIDTRLQPRLQKLANLDHDVVIMGSELHGRRRSLHVHQDQSRPKLSDKSSHRRITEGSDVVNDVSAGFETCGG